MKVQHTTDDKVNGTHLQGHITATYEQLVKVFGPHTCEGGYKVQVYWQLEFEDGTIATIYDWKCGKEYCRVEFDDDSGLDYVDVTNWNVGGFNKQSHWLVQDKLLGVI